MNKSPFRSSFPVTEEHLAELELLSNWGQKLGLYFEFPQTKSNGVDVIVGNHKRAPTIVFNYAFAPDVVNATLFTVCAIVEKLPETAIVDYWEKHCGESRGAEIGIRKRFEEWFNE